MNSMIVASVVTNLDNAMVEDKTENSDEMDVIGVATTLADDLDEFEKAEIKRDLKSRDAKLTFMTNHQSFIKLRQTPLFKCSNGRRNTERVEDKLLLLHALEINLKEYNDYRIELGDLIEEITALNDPTTTNEDALRILACSKNGALQGATLNPNDPKVRASNISKMHLRSRLVLEF